MKRLLVILALTCALFSVSLGADMPTCGAPAPAPGDVPSTGSIPTCGLSALLTILDLAF